MLLSPGVWKVNEATGQIDSLRRLHLLISWLNGSDGFAIGNDEAMSVERVSEYAKCQWNEQMDNLLMSDRMQGDAAGKDWGSQFFEQLDKMEKRDHVFHDYGKFLDDLDWVLKARLQKKRVEKYLICFQKF